jgi:diamine N-acetyltransferase
MQLSNGTIRIRPLEEGDLNLLAKWRNDSMSWFFTSLPLAISEQRDWYNHYLDSMTELMYIVEHSTMISEGAESLKPVGAMGLVGVDSLHRRAELGRVVMDRESTGRGYATAAISILSRLAFDGLNLHRLFIEVLADNEAAIGLYEKCGFVKEGRLRRHVWKDGRYQDVVIMGLLREGN